MDEILRDTSWQFIITTIIAILAIVAGFVIYLLQRSKKSLAYEVISKLPLLSAKEEIKNELQILYKGNPVKNVHLFTLKIINDGNQPIASNDFEKPLYFNLSGDVQILSAEVVSTKPDNLNPSLIYDVNRFGIEPLLLNSKDFIEIKAIINTEKFSFKPDARIVGVKEVKEAAIKPGCEYYVIFLLFIVFAVWRFFVTGSPYTFLLDLLMMLAGSALLGFIIADAFRYFTNVKD